VFTSGGVEENCRMMIETQSTPNEVERHCGG
jgi:hypothetical protein